MSRFWVNTVSLEHVLRGVDGGFTQADHGRPTRLRRLARGDGLVFYSPRTAMRAGEVLQQFTALGTITDDEPFQVVPDTGTAGPSVRPWRRAMDFADSAPADVRPLLADLSFVPDERRWGLPFRRGLFEVPQADFVVIASAMGVSLAASPAVEAQ